MSVPFQEISSQHLSDPPAATFPHPHMNHKSFEGQVPEVLWYLCHSQPFNVYNKVAIFSRCLFNVSLTVSQCRVLTLFSHKPCGACNFQSKVTSRMSRVISGQNWLCSSKYTWDICMQLDNGTSSPQLTLGKHCALRTLVKLHLIQGSAPPVLQPFDRLEPEVQAGEGKGSGGRAKI